MCALGNIYYTPSNSVTSSSFYIKHTINRDLTISQTSLVLYTLFALGSMLFGYYHSNHVLPTQLLDLSCFTFRLQYDAMEAHMSHSLLTLQLLHLIMLLKSSMLHSQLQLVVSFQKSLLTLV